MTHPSWLGWVSVSDWSFIAVEKAELLSNWLRPLQLTWLGVVHKNMKQNSDCFGLGAENSA